MVELAVADDERFEASRIELEREGPSYTSDTLEQLAKESPKDELFLILGGRPGGGARVLARAGAGAGAGDGGGVRAGVVGAERDHDQDRSAARAPSECATSTCR